MPAELAVGSCKHGGQGRAAGAESDARGVG